MLVRLTQTFRHVDGLQTQSLTVLVHVFDLDLDGLLHWFRNDEVSGGASRRGDRRWYRLLLSLMNHTDSLTRNCRPETR